MATNWRTSDYDKQDIVFTSQKPRGGGPRNAEKAMASGGGAELDKKWGGGGNKQNASGKNMQKIEAETEDFHVDHVGTSVARAIQQARQKKEMSQKDLAQKINEKPQVVNEYEAGKAIPNQAIIGKLERTLGVKLRGKDIGQPLAPKTGKK